jgi:tetratricopeptide (TPR) repeat protein
MALFGIKRRQPLATGRVPGPSVSDVSYSGDTPTPLAIARSREKAGELGQAVEILTRAIQESPSDADLWLERASLYHQWGRYIEAHRLYQDTYQRFPDNINAIARLAWTCLAIDKLAEAEPLMHRVATLRPNVADSHYGLGTLYRSKKQFDQAVKEFEATIAIDESAAHAHVSLGVSLMDLKRQADAEQPLRRAIELQPDHPGNWVNLAVNLYTQNKSGAEAAYRKAIELERTTGTNAEAFVGYASYLRNVDRMSEALELYRKYLPANPNTAALTQYGMCKLHIGEFASGWSLYEFRWLQDPLISLRANLETPLWQGQELKGRTILVRAEQGVGDVIQFARYLRNVKALGAHVLFQGRDGMEELSTRFCGVDSIINLGEQLPSFDYFTNLMSLPRFFGNDPAAIAPCAPYVRANPEGIEAFRRRRTSGKVHVGIVWAGNPTHKQDSVRSMPFDKAVKLADVDGVQLVSLQKGDAASALLKGSGNNVEDWAPFLRHFGDTADAIGALDAVVSVDTSVAHLSGALGAPTFVALPRPAEWRWMDGKMATDWYPSATLFRQDRQGNWDGVVDAIAKAMRELRVRQRSSVGDDRRGAAEEDKTFEKTEYCPPSVPEDLPVLCEASEGVFMVPQTQAGSASAALLRYGEWHHNQAGLLAGLVKIGQVAIHVGAGIGAHSVVLSRLIGNQGHLLVYEASQLARRLLSENLRSNKVRNATVMLRQLDTGQGNSIGRPEKVDDLLLEELDWIKIDDSLAACSVVDGAKATIWRTRPKLLVNVNDGGQELLVKLHELAYQCWHFDSPYVREENFNGVAVLPHDKMLQTAVLAIPEEVAIDVPLVDCRAVERTY